jgi:hypothetical protein
MVGKVSRLRVQEHSFKKRDKKLSAKQMLKLLWNPGYNTWYHWCTRVENPGKGVAQFFSKILRRGSKLSEKKCHGGSPCFRSYCIFNNMCFKIRLGGPIVILNPSPPHPLLCASIPGRLVMYPLKLFLRQLWLHLQ